MIDRLGAGILLALARVRLSLSDRWARILANAAAFGMRVLIPSRRRIADRNIRRVFPDMTSQDRKNLAIRAYRNAAANFSDLLTILQAGGRESLLRRTRVEGFEHLHRALAAGKGCIAISAHYGAFPLMGSVLAAMGVRYHYLYRRPKSPSTDGFFQDWLEHAGYRNIEDSPRHLAASRCLKALGEGACVCILADQHFPAGVEIPFFGNPALTGIGPALLAARSRAPLVAMCISRLPDDSHLVRIEPPIAPPVDRSREALTAVIAEFTLKIEAWIREDPAQWFWVHRRWKQLDRAEDSERNR
jgi:KDO2-lipid IV(A) lauroyltransferase